MQFNTAHKLCSYFLDRWVEIQTERKKEKQSLGKIIELKENYYFYNSLSFSVSLLCCSSNKTLCVDGVEGLRMQSFVTAKWYKKKKKKKKKNLDVITFYYASKSPTSYWRQKKNMDGNTTTLALNITDNYTYIDNEILVLFFLFCCFTSARVIFLFSKFIFTFTYNLSEQQQPGSPGLQFK